MEGGVAVPGDLPSRALQAVLWPACNLGRYGFQFVLSGSVEVETLISPSLHLTREWPCGR